MAFKRLLALVPVLLLASACSTSKEAHLERGIKFVEQGKQEDAAIQFQRALQKDPNYGEAYYRLGLLRATQEKPVEAITALRQAAQLLPNNAEVKAKLIDTALTEYLGDPRRPQNLYEILDKAADELLAADANSFPALRAKGYLAMSAARPEEAIGFMNRAIQANPKAPDVCLILVQNLILNNQAAEAEAAARKYLVLHPNYGPLYDVLYGHYASTRRPAEAEAILQAKVAANPKELLYSVQLAEHYHDLGKTQPLSALIESLLANEKDFPRAPVELGDLFTRKRNWTQATAMYEAGLRRSPSEKPLYQKRLAALLASQGKVGEAAQTFDAVLANNPKDTEALYSRAALRMATRAPAEMDLAVQQFKSLVAAEPENAEYRLSLARGYLQTGRVREAQAEYQELLKRKQDHFEALTELAGAFIQVRNAESALTYAERALSYGPANPSARLVRTAAWALQGRYADIRPELTQLNREYPYLKQAKLQMAMLLVAEKKYSEAEALFRAHYTPGEGDLGSLRGLVALYLEQAQPQKALAAVQQEYARFPQSDALRELMLETAAAANQLPLALEVARKAAAQSPDSATAAAQLAGLYLQTGNQGQALEQYRKAVRLEPANASLHALLGDALAATGKPAEAVAAYRESLRLEPDNPAVKNNLAFQLAETGKNLDEALTLAQDASRRLPNNPWVADTLGHIYLKQRKYENAVQALRGATAQAPQNPAFRLRLAAALLAQGNRAEAKTELLAILSQAPPGSPERTQAEKMMTGI